jgi:hypothetical protein
MIGERGGFAPGFLELGDGEERGGMDSGDGAAGVEGDGELGVGDGFGEFSDGEDVEGALGEEGVVERAAEGFDGSANDG